MKIALVKTEPYPLAKTTEEFVCIFDPSVRTREGRCCQSFLVYSVDGDQMLSMRSRGSFEFTETEITHWFRNATEFYNKWVKIINGDHVIGYLRKVYQDYQDTYKEKGD